MNKRCNEFDCPACGKPNPREMRQCPKLKGEAICVHCCESCDTYDAETFRCTWHMVNKTIIIDEEVKRLNRRIKYLEQVVRKQYKNNQPKKGNILLNEERNCISQLNRLERLKEKEMNKELINSAIAKITEEALSIKDAFSQMIEEHLTDICNTDAVATKLLAENKSLKAFCDEMWKEAKSKSTKCAAGSSAYISDKECFEKAEAYYEITEEDKHTKQQSKVIDITELL